MSRSAADPDPGIAYSTINPHKRRLARLCDVTGANRVFSGLQRWTRRSHLRAVNYHDVPPPLAAELESHLRHFAERFAPIGRRELISVQRGEWRSTRPGLILTFDDGLRSHAEVVAPLLEKYGFPGWFFLPVGFLDAPVSGQAAFAREHRISVAQSYPDGRLAMTWDQARALERHHVLGCHTMHHARLPASLGPDVLRVEIDEAKRAMEQRLGHEMDVFCWVGGEEWGYSREAAQRVREAGFRIGFMTNNAFFGPGDDLLQIQRTNLEADFPAYVLRFQMAGFLDWLYFPKRRRVNRLTAVSP